MEKPSQEELTKALQAASTAHHDFETNVLQGVRDEQWPGWYAAYVLGRLGDFVSASTLSNWLSNAPASDDWPHGAAAHVEEQLRATRPAVAADGAR